MRRRGVLERNDPRNSMVENKPKWRTFACFALDEETADTGRGPRQNVFLTAV